MPPCAVSAVLAERGLRESARHEAAVNFRPDDVVAVGFGSAGLYRDGVMVADGEALIDTDNPLTGAVCEQIAAADPDHKWEIVLNGPLSGATYERTTIGWVLVASNAGFA